MPLLVLLVISFLGCAPQVPAEARAAGPNAPPGPPAEDMKPNLGAVIIATATGEQRYTVELAIKPLERNRGLMFREQLSEDAGMLFVFENTQVQSFWMKNTRIPLDMIFIDDELTIAGIIESAEPLTLTSRSIGRPSRYVLELAGGVSRKRGIAAGQKVTFEGVPNDLMQKGTP